MAIDELFAIDAQAREQNLALIERHQLRKQKARPILESIKSQIETAKGQTLPKSALAKACNYTLTFWNRLTNSLPGSFDHGVEHQPRRERHPASGIGSQKTGSISGASKPDRASQPSSPSSKPAVACRSPSAIISLLSCLF
jgi:hypothetical protein